jgi:hypothetical protein
MRTRKQFATRTEETSVFENLTNVSLSNSQMIRIRGGNSDPDDDSTASPNDNDQQEDGFN